MAIELIPDRPGVFVVELRGIEIGKVQKINAVPMEFEIKRIWEGQVVVRNPDNSVNHKNLGPFFTEREAMMTVLEMWVLDDRVLPEIVEAG